MTYPSGIQKIPASSKTTNETITIPFSLFFNFRNKYPPPIAAPTINPSKEALVTVNERQRIKRTAMMPIQTFLRINAIKNDKTEASDKTIA